MNEIIVYLITVVIACILIAIADEGKGYLSIPSISAWIGFLMIFGVIMSLIIKVFTWIVSHISIDLI
jgi:hypothetical protein